MQNKVLLIILTLILGPLGHAYNCEAINGVDKSLFKTQVLYSCHDLLSSKGERNIKKGSFICVQKLISKNVEVQKDRLFVALNMNDEFIIEDEGFGDLEMSFFAKKTEQGNLTDNIFISQGTPDDRFILNIVDGHAVISKNIDELTRLYEAKFKCLINNIKI